MDYEEIDAKRIIEKIRLHLRPRIDAVSPSALMRSPSSGPPLPSLSATADDAVARGLRLLNTRADVYNVQLKSHRRVFGSMVLAAKKLLRQLLTPMLEQQGAYNAANIGVIEALKNQAEAHAASSAQLDRRLTELEQVAGLQAGLNGRAAELEQQVAGLQAGLNGRAAELEQQVAALQAGLSRRTAELEQHLAGLQANLDRQRDATREQIGRAERKLRRILHSLNLGVQKADGPGSGLEPAMPAIMDAQSVAEPEFDYAGFEERFRGSEADIKQRQARYLQDLKGNDPVLDLGCGRGEFLELLREAGVEAHGVDINLDMVLLCQEKGLDVIQDDAFGYLLKVPDSSLGAILAAQFIEHFPPNRIIRFTRVCHQKLKPGGVLIFETINPACLTVFARSFFLDPTHVWPFHPETLRFLFDTTGFADVRLDFFSPVEPSIKLPYLNAAVLGPDTALFNRCVNILNELLLGFQDFAITGQKSLAPPLTGLRLHQ